MHSLSKYNRFLVLFKPGIIALIIYVLFNLILFFQYPHNNTIGSHCNGWLEPVLSNYIINAFSDFFYGVEHTVSMFPTENIIKWGDTYFGYLSFFILFKLFGFNEIYSWYLGIVLVFSLNGLGLFFVSYQITKNFFAAIIAGFMFICSNFVFVNIDDAHIFFYFLPLLAIFYLLKYKEKGSSKFLFISIILIGIQLYTSFYVFFYGSIIYAIVFIYTSNYFRSITYKQLGLILASLILFFIIVFPYFMFYYRVYTSKEFFNPNSLWTEMASYSGINLGDFFRVMPNNILYKSSFSESFVYFSFQRSAFIGTLFLSLSLYFSIRYFHLVYVWIIVAIIGILLSITGFELLGIYLKSPSEILHSLYDFYNILRISYRAFAISIISFSIITSIGIARIFNRYSVKNQAIITLLILTFHFAENIPYRLPFTNWETVINNINYENSINLPDGFQSKNLIPEQSLMDIIAITDKNSVLLCLPSKNIFGDKYTGSLTMARELLYMVHQTYFKRNMFNGINGYFPKSRVEIQTNIENIPNVDAFNYLVSKGLTHIVFYKDLILNTDEDILFSLKNSDMLQLIKETKRYAIFKVSSNS